MKTTAKQFTNFGNTGLVQLLVEPVTTLRFLPGGPEMRSGGLVITEANESGVVGKLVALNNTGSFLVLTDADVLVGAKQNRILNRSMLLAPQTKTIIDVSCIEKLRWQYKTRNFTSPGTAADPDLRKAKASSFSFMSFNPMEPGSDTQNTVWSHISAMFAEEGLMNSTESYQELASHKLVQKAEKFPECEPHKGCTGLAVLVNGKVNCVDIFGTEEIYKYYFPLLRDSAFRMARTGDKIKPVDIHEAYFKVLDALDNFETAQRITERSYAGSGILKLAENNNFTGFELTYEGELVHEVMFCKQ